MTPEQELREALLGVRDKHGDGTQCWCLRIWQNQKGRHTPWCEAAQKAIDNSDAATAPTPAPSTNPGTIIADDILRRIAKRYENCSVNIYPEMPCLTPVEAVLRCAKEEGFMLTNIVPPAEPVVPEREPLSTAAIACIEKLAKRDLSDSNASYRAGYRDACRHVIEESGLLTVLAVTPRAAGGQREPSLTEKQILTVLYHGRTMVNFNHVPELTRAIDWLSQDFRSALSSAEPQVEERGKT